MFNMQWYRNCPQYIKLKCKLQKSVYLSFKEYTRDCHSSAEWLEGLRVEGDFHFSLKVSVALYILPSALLFIVGNFFLVRSVQGFATCIILNQCSF